MKKNVDNDIVQEVEAEKEDANVDVENASNEIEVEKKDDESNATPSSTNQQISPCVRGLVDRRLRRSK